MFGLADRRIKIKVNSVWVMFWYNRTYMAVIGKRVQTNEKRKLWLTKANRNFKETNVPRSAHHKHDHLRKTHIGQRQAKNEEYS